LLLFEKFQDSKQQTIWLHGQEWKDHIAMVIIAQQYSDLFLLHLIAFEKDIFVLHLKIYERYHLSNKKQLIMLLCTVISCPPFLFE
jgi:hypothetical protein